MKRILLFVGVILLIALFGALVVLNPGEVEFHPDHLHNFHPMLGLLLIFTFCAGVLVAVLGGSLRNLSSTLGNWRGRRASRRATQAGEWHQAGEDLAWGGELERSRALLTKACKHHPGSSAAALALASSYMDTGEHSAAQRVLEVALARHAHDPDVRYALGETLRRRGESGEAIRMLETVRVQHPRAPRVLISLRELYRESGRWKEAADVQDVYLATLPTDARAGERERLVQFRYQAALALPDAEARLTALDAVVQADRTFVPALVSLGDALLEQGRGDEAKKLWEKAFRAQPRLVFVERLLATATTPRERERVLALLAKQSSAVDPDCLHLLLARAALADNALERAEVQLSAVARQDTPTVQRCWAEVHHRRGDDAAAWRALTSSADHLGALAADHRCRVCGRASEAWAGYCDGCERWDTYRSGAEGIA